MQKKLFIKTFGCQMNEYDSNKIFDILNYSNNIIQTNYPEDADIILLNTCSVRIKAQEKLFSNLGRLYKLKLKKPNLLIGVGGCVASQEGKAILKRAPYVDIIFGPKTLHRLPQMIYKRKISGKIQIDIDFPEIEKFDYMPPAKINGITAFVSITEGCSKYCSYCIIPYTRGEEVSRKFNSIINEIYELVSQGVKEITLLGQNVNAYKDTIIDRNGLTQIIDFSLLIEYIANISDIKRIRFITSHPKEFTQRLINIYSKTSKLVNHLYLPAQHGSNRILSKMKRGYTINEYKLILKNLREIRPDISISSDFIVGFPGETNEDFNELIKLVKNIGYDKSFSFIFSPRPGTPAANLIDNVSHKTKLKRLKYLQEIIKKNVNNINLKMIGSIQKILVESRSKKNISEMQGRTENNRIVNFNSDSNNLNLIGKLIDVKILKICSSTLKAKII
nr:tRNA (N6-isopentenyl adenosine(37)-C2)-methylthiotransferase MiaB [Candidatus Profftella armatura (Diaphorina cf. continua)]